MKKYAGKNAIDFLMKLFGNDIVLLRNEIAELKERVLILENNSSGGNTGGGSTGDDNTGGNTGSGDDTHTHTYTSEVTTEPGCETTGIRTYTCECGDTYTEEIDALGHTYVDGVCTVCGAEDPNYVQIELSPDGELSNWNYTLDETDGTVILNYYTGSATDVTVYGKYQLDGVEYNTKIGSNDSNATSNYMFAGKSSMGTITFKKGIDTSDVASISYMFYNCKALTSLDLTSFDTSNVTNMNCMFYNCTSLISLDLTSFDTSKVTNMSYMFYGCNTLTSLDVSGFDTSKVTNMTRMFYECKALTSLDLTSFDTSKVTNMSYMFYKCTELTEIKVTTGKWVIASGCSTTNMFSNCGVSAVTRVAA